MLKIENLFLFVFTWSCLVVLRSLFLTLGSMFAKEPKPVKEPTPVKEPKAKAKKQSKVIIEQSSDDDDVFEDKPNVIFVKRVRPKAKEIIKQEEPPVPQQQRPPPPQKKTQSRCTCSTTSAAR